MTAEKYFGGLVNKRASSFNLRQYARLRLESIILEAVKKELTARKCMKCKDNSMIAWTDIQNGKKSHDEIIIRR